uniref:Uncharacterized protein n=1 Tax=Arundo donax TaxID=35708 RepID=A0A0A8YKI6_ARUDO
MKVKQNLLFRIGNERYTVSVIWSGECIIAACDMKHYSKSYQCDT